ncbi:MAG: response regulator [Desulfobacterales bacterium]|nr:response regulator [Desulfobacterales bacterium]
MPTFKSISFSPTPDHSALPMEVHPLTLTFSGPCAFLEAPFLDDFVDKSIAQIRVALLLSFFFYATFGILDAIVAPEIKERLWAVRFGIVCPSFVLIYLCSYSRHATRFLQVLMMAMALIGGLAIVYMTMIGNALVASTYYAGLMLVLMFIYSFVWMRFVRATLCGWTIIIVYVVAAAYNDDMPREILINNLFFCISANLIGMAMCYAFEYYNRRDFYLRRLLNLQHTELEAAKTALEERVSERTQMLATANEELRREIEAHQRLAWEKQVLEGQLRHAQKMEAIGTLAGGIAHDFNNILAAIMGHSELALMQMANRKEAEASLMEVLSASHRAKDLVGQILSFSRQSESELKPIQISRIVMEAMRLLKATLPATLTIRQNIQAAQSIVVADATQIHQIVINLCTNAAHAMEPEGGTLTVALEEIDIQPQASPESTHPSQLEAGKYVCLGVTDTGHGIPEHLLERIFDPYFTTKAKGVGTGLGLAVVRGIVQNHGGIIDVKSRPGQGTEFKVYLPRVEGREIANGHQLQLLSLGNERIMLVDDEVGLADLGAKLLTALGYRAASYTSPEKALAELRERTGAFDLVITDMIMPVMSGEALAREILALRPDMPIIVYTGFSNMISADRIRQLGVKAVLRKPVTIFSLSQAIRKVLMERAAGPPQID